jgi:hypothetical protein
MSGASARPPTAESKGFGRAARDVVLALIVMNSAVFLWQSDRIEKECACSHTGAQAIQWVAGTLLGAFLLWLLCLAAGACWQAQPHWFRRFLGEQRHHVIAALVPWITAIVGILLLTVPSQTADMLAGLQGNTWAEISRPLVPFGVGALVWGMATWFCSRWAIDIERRTSQRAESVLALWNPRLIALMTGFAIIIIAVKAAGLCSRAVLVASVVAATVLLFAVFRRPVARLLYSSWRSGGAARLEASQRAGKNRREAFVDDLRAAPGGPVAVLGALGVSLIVIGSFALTPEFAAAILQAPGTVLLGIGCLTMIVTFLSKLGLRLTHFPVLLTSIVVTTLLGYRDIGVNHDIRKLPAPAGFMVPPSPTLDQAAEEWLRTCGPNLAQGTNHLNVVLVSTAGGASRAALWTLNALADLQDEDPQFPRRVFAISAVSGGALGATVWSALLAHEKFDCAAPISDARTAIDRREAGQAILSHDFLAPALAVALSRDLILGAVPLNLILRPLGIKVEDRSSALEQAWEAAWAERFDTDPNPLAAEFLSLWNRPFNRPLLLLNGTVEDTGQPIVTAPISLVDEQGRSYGDLPATYDARWLLHEEIRTSTAILNAARFPVITSQGDIRLRLCPDGSNFAEGKCPVTDASTWRRLSVVDGGYFDNIGGGTTVRAASALTRMFQKLQDQDHMFSGVELRIMVVGINSDPDRLISKEARKWQYPNGKSNGAINPPVDQVMRCGQEPSTLTIAEKGLDNTLNAEIAPFLAIIATQSGHSALRMAELNQQFCSPRVPPHPPAPTPTKPTPAWPTNYILLSLCPIGDAKGTVSLPLNWVLSRSTRDLFAGKDKPRWDLATQCDNATELGDYHAWATQG